MAVGGAGTGAAEGQAGAEGAAGAEGGQQGGEQPQGGPDLKAVLDRFGELDESFSQRFEQLEGRLASTEEPGHQEGYGQGYGQQQGEPELFLDEQTGQVVDAQGRPVDPRTLAESGGNGQPDAKLLGAVQQQMQSQMQEQLAPILEYFHDQQAAELEDRYEPLRDTKYAEKIVKAAEERASRYGKPELARNADFIELLHLAEVGRQKAAGQETPAGASEQGVALETDGVSTPGQGEPDLGDQIVAAGGRKSGFFS